MTDPVKQTTENAIGKGKAGPGRPKGVPNKQTSLLKDAIIIAATNAGGKDGMIGYLTTQALENPKAFLTILGKVIPVQLSGDPDQPLVHEIRRTIVRPGL